MTSNRITDLRPTAVNRVLDDVRRFQAGGKTTVRPPAFQCRLALRLEKLYRNADDKGHGFGDTALAVEHADTSGYSCYASIDTQTGYPIVIIINKSPRNAARSARCLIQATRC